ncbi:hypothetical protein CDAR_175301 [Caerostris darwini]|uniref:Maturase K n=1 Tax=Caerostris darwini TaxID=1538125 RepID=A0AAV4VZJ9_9ARAC|nr:hypothetical protein CDAR_175301 [Caerostris darwini]
MDWNETFHFRKLTSRTLVNASLLRQLDIRRIIRRYLLNAVHSSLIKHSFETVAISRLFQLAVLLSLNHDSFTSHKSLTQTYFRARIHQDEAHSYHNLKLQQIKRGGRHFSCRTLPTTPSMLECKYSCSFFLFLSFGENSSPNLDEEFAASLLKLIGTRAIFHSFILSRQKFHVVGNAGDVLLRVGQSGVQLSLGYLPCNLWRETLCATSSASEH